MTHDAMTAAAAALRHARDAGIELWLEGGRLRFRAPPDALTTELRTAIGDHRADIITLLAAEAEAHVEEAPIAANQQGLWFLAQVAPDSVAYNVSFAARLHGALDPALFQEALQVLIDRYEVLRTTYTTRDGNPVRLVAGRHRAHLVVRDVVGQSDEQVRAQVEQDYAVPFDLACEPVMRTHLYREAPDRHVLLIVLHHITVDGASLFVLAEELIGVYSALAAGKPLPTPKDVATYSEFVAWQRQTLARADEQRAYWQEVLSPPPAPLELPYDRPRPRFPAMRGATVWRRLGSTLTARLRALAREEDVTDFVVLLTLWYALLHRITGQNDITVGTPVMGRPAARFTRTIGDLMNMLPLRVRQVGGYSLRDLMGQVKNVALSGMAHQELPLAEMVEHLAGEGGTPSGPPFQTFFVLQDFVRFSGIGAILSRTDGRRDVGALRLSHYALDQQEGQFDLSLDVWPADDELLCCWRFDRDLLDHVSVERWTENFETLIASAVAHPDAAIDDLEIIPEEHYALLAAWNETERPYDLDTTLHATIAEQAARTPDAIAVRAPDSDTVRELTYHELDRRASALAVRLQRMGVGRDVRVAVCMHRSVELVVALLATLKAGGAYVPVDPGYPEDRVRYMLEDCGALVLLSQAAIAPSLPAVQGMTTLDVDALWSELDDDSRPVDLARPDSLAYVIYTSGSTGTPKGAMIEHRSIINRLLWTQEHFRLQDGDVVLQKTPYSFDVSVWEFFWPLMVGRPLIMARPDGHKDPAYLARLIEGEAVTTVHFVPSMLGVFLDSVDGQKLSSLRRVICSGEALSPALRDRFFAMLPEVALTNLYGPTEAAVDVSWWHCSSRYSPWRVPIGWPVANTQLHVLDARMRRVPLGVPGELYIGGVQVGRGYLNRSELTHQRFVDDPFEAGQRLYRTGDRARVLHDGAIEFLGRLDHQVKVRGFRIELGEIEARLQSHPDIAEAVVAASDDRLVAYVVGRTRTPDTDELRPWLASSLPEHMVPNTFVHLDAIPLSPSGKADRAALPAPDAMGPRDRAERTPARTETEIALAQIWSAVLGVPDARREDSFFELGGHSLLAARIVAMVRDRFQIELPVMTVFDAPTLAELAARIQPPAPAAPSTIAVETFDF